MKECVPNMAVKGTRRTRVLLEVWFFITVRGFAKTRQMARPLPLR